ncbi:MAG: hypothetical protein PVG89_15970 [Gammaproteobacteria bacterium]|jgi:hypothetical protein
MGRPIPVSNRYIATLISEDYGMNVYLKDFLSLILYFVLFIAGGVFTVYFSSEIVGATFVGEQDLGRLLAAFLLGGVVACIFACLLIKNFLSKNKKSNEKQINDNY